MANLHVFVHAVLMFVGQSTACVEWMIADPPIIFGKTAQLSCATVTPNISYITHNVTSWLGGEDSSTLTHNDVNADTSKYAEIRKWQRGKFESILQIFKFDEKDVNVDYSCSIGGHENRKKLSLESDKFEYHPDKDTTTVLAHLRNGYLDVIVKILKVYPIPKCTIMYNDNIISQRLTTKTRVNGIFYMVVEEVEHQVDVCSGQLIVTCVVGKTEIPIHQESFNRCTKTKEESPEQSCNWIISINAALLLFVIVIGTLCFAKYGKLKTVPCVRHVAEIDNQLIQRIKWCATIDTGQGESHEMMSPLKSGND